MITRQTLFITGIAGTTSVVLLTAGLLGSGLALPLLLLSPLPIAIASLGWGSVAGLSAAIAGFLGVVVLSHIYSALFYGAAFALPIAYLSHITGLSRQNTPDEKEQWFPLGDVLLRTGLIAGGVFGLAFAQLNYNEAEISRTAVEVFDDILRQAGPVTTDGLRNGIDAQQTELITFSARLIPFFLPGIWLLILWFNLWLGAKIVRISGRLNRPSFTLYDTELPVWVLFVFTAAIIAHALLTPPISHISSAFIGSIGMVLVFMGCTTMHVLVKGNKFGGVIIGLLYSSIFFFVFPIFIMALLGLIDLVFKIRQRFLAANPT